MNWLRRQWQRTKRRSMELPPPKATRPSVLTRLGWKLFGLPSAMPKPPKATRPSVLTRLGWKLFGPPSAMPKPPKAIQPSVLARFRWKLFGPLSPELKPPEAVSTFFLWRFLRALFFWLPIGIFFESIEDGIPPGYWRTRDWRRLLYGMPALLILVGTIGLGVAMARLDNAQLAHANLKRAEELRQANNERESLIHAEAASRLNPNEPECLMALAKLSARQGDVARQKEILMSLAPNNRLGYPPAHLMLAQVLLNESPTTLHHFPADAKKHLLLIADQAGDLGYRANALLGANYMDAGYPLEAIPCLRRTPAKSKARVLLAVALAFVGDSNAAEAEAKTCVEAFEAELKDNPADVRARLQLAQCLRVLKRYGNAIFAYDEGIALAPPEEAVRTLVKSRNETFVKWLTVLEKDPKADQTARFAVLARALAVAPTEVEFLARLLAFTDPKSEEGAKARALLEDQLTKGLNIGFAHFVLGTYAWSEHDRDKSEADRDAHRKSAEFHLEIAHKKMPLDASIAHNLAAVLADSNPPQLERALSLANSAIERVPNFAEFHNTRGYILMKMERCKEAIPDLEFALAGGAHPDQAIIHAALAESYEKIGDAKMAASHRDAAKLKGRNPP